MATRTVFIGRDNPIDLVMVISEADGDITYVDASSFTRYVLDCGDIELDTATLGISPGGIFDVSVPVVIAGANVVALRLRLGLYSPLVEGNYKARLIGFNSAYPEGLVWQDRFPFKVVA
jgi:hypothetical protein